MLDFKKIVHKVTYPLYSLDLAGYDFARFPALEQTLRGRRLQENIEAKKAAETFLKQFPDSFFPDAK